MTPHDNDITPPPFLIIEGGKTHAPALNDDLPFSTPADVLEVPGVKRISGVSVFFEIERERFESLPEQELHWLQALVKFDLHLNQERLEPGDAARAIMTALQTHDRLTRRRQKILRSMPRHAHQLSPPAPEFMTLMSWMQRWWDALRFP